MEIGGNDSLKSDINVTPLVDVMLVLLIIFMLVTPLLQPGVGVTLPEARNVRAVSESEQDVLVVTLRDDGGLLVGSDPIPPALLASRLQSERAAKPNRLLQIKAGRSTAYGRVKDLIRAGRDAGFGSAALVAERIEDDAAIDGKSKER